VETENRVHPIVLIPLCSALIAAALAAAILAREPGRSANRMMAAVLACAVWWSLGQVLTLTASGPAAALAYARLELFGGSLLGPFALHLLYVVLPEPFVANRRWLVAEYAVGAVIAVASVASPWFVPGVVQTSFGFAPLIGPLVLWGYVALLALPVVALIRLLSRSTLQRASRRHSLPWIEFAIGLTSLVTSITDFALPALGRHVPRLGSASVAIWALVTWLSVYRFRGVGLSPRTFANEILATLPDGVALVRLDGRIRAANAKLAQLARQTPERLLGRPLDELIREPQAAAAGSERECELVSASGARLPVSLSDATLRDADGVAIGRVLVIRDLEELVSLRSRLLTSARLAAVGQLAAGIAHEINNPIAYVRSNVGLLERHWKTLASAFETRESPPAVGPALARSQELLRAAADGIDRVASVVRDVGGFSWKGGAENELTDPVELLELAVRVAGPQLRRKADVERSFAKLPLVPCRPQELMQVLLNLVLAGVHSIERRGRLRLSSGSDGRSVWLEIAVDGAGLAPEALDPILDPFATPGAGPAHSGLGLAISRQMLERQGGRILVASEAGRGLRFHVALPIAAAGEARA
jgi:signal transduction histidine kinase